MRRRSLYIGALAAVLLATVGTAEARMHAPYRGHRITASAVVPPPLDGLGNPSAAYSFRKLKTDYAGSAFRIRRASDNAETDINFLGFVPGLGSPWDEAAAAAHCAATSCFIKTWYDQSGNARDLTNATAANQPALVFNCIGALPCMQLTLTTHTLVSAASVAPATGVATFGVVANRLAGTAFCTLIRQNGGTGNRIAAHNTTLLWSMSGATGSFTATAANAAWHAAQMVFNGASSVIAVDGVDTAGTLTNATVSGQVALLGGTGSTCNQTEAIIWDNVVLSAGERAVLTANQRAFWGF